MKRAFAWAGGILLLAIVAFGLVFYTPDTDPAAMRAKYGGPTSQFVDLGGGLTVHLRDEGPRNAPVIVLLHGSNASLHTWDQWTRALLPRWRVVRFDQPGHGLTGAYQARNYSRAAFVDITDRVTEKLGVTRFVLAGNSMGGSIAWAYAHRHSAKLTGLVLVDASGQPEPSDSSPPLGFRLARTPVIRDVMAAFTPRSLIEDGLRQSVVNQALVTPAMIERYWELRRDPGNRIATMDRFATPREPPVTAPLPRPLPTLVIWGAEDKLIPPASAAWFKRRVPAAEVIIYPNVGHLPMEEIPARSVADLKSWLAKLPSAR